MIRKWNICVLIVLNCINGEIYYNCPNMCKCALEDVTDCKNNELTNLPENIYLQVRVLDLSFNHFTSIPTNISVFEKLESINLKHNRINALGTNSLKGLGKLKELDLSDNTFARWADIHPQALNFSPLRILDLSHNTLKGFPNIQSNTLENLHLTNCSITSFKNDVLESLPNLKTLNIGNNLFPIIANQIISKNLTSLNLTMSGIKHIYINSLVDLPNLKELRLAKNFEMKSFTSTSTTLKYLDLSDCNLESLPKSALPNLEYLDVRGNHLRRIEGFSFKNMSKLNILNLTYNAIEDINVDAFKGLKDVNRIDLSYNIITKLDPKTFKGNKDLKQLILSHNYLTELPKFEIESLVHLDLSECEINTVAANSLYKMPSLIALNLSRNVFTSIPNNFSSPSLRVLDLSLCRISSLRNETFRNIRNLISLSLRGNRLVEIRTSFLHHVSIVTLSDNSWRCECNSNYFKELYGWLTKIDSDVYQLTCQTPEMMEGRRWYEACGDIWFDLNGNNGKRAWLYSLVFIFIFCVIFCVMISLNRARRRKLRAEQEQRERQQTQAREILRRMRVAEREATEAVNSNAPDPRELERPPSYHEAISMPRLTGSCGSLNSRKLSSSNNNNNEGKPKKPRRKRRRSKTDEQSSSRRNDNSDNEPTLSVFMESDV